MEYFCVARCFCSPILLIFYQPLLQEAMDLEADFLQAILLGDPALSELRDDALDGSLDLEDDAALDAADVEAVLVGALDQRPVYALQQLLLEAEDA